MGKLLNGRHLSADRHLSSLHRCSNAVSPAFSRQKSQHAKSSAASEGIALPRKLPRQAADCRQRRWSEQLVRRHHTTSTLHCFY